MTSDREIFSTLVKLGKLTESDIREIFGLSEEMRRFVDLLQLLIGAEDADEYVKEQTFAKCWGSPAHLKWIENAEQLIKVLDLTVPDALDALVSAYNLIKQNREEVILFISLYVYPAQLADLLDAEVKLLPAHEPDPVPGAELAEAPEAEYQNPDQYSLEL